MNNTDYVRRRFSARPDNIHLELPAPIPASTKQPGDQGNQGDVNKGNTDACYEPLHALGLRTEVVIAVALHIPSNKIPVTEIFLI